MAPLFNRIGLLVAFSLLLLPAAKAKSLVWAQDIVGSSTSASGTGVTTGTTDSAGNLYTVGAFGGTAAFGGSASSLTAVSNQDMFVMKKDPSGNLIWVKPVNGISSGVYGCFGHAVDVDDAGNVFISGMFRDSFDFDPGPAVYKLNSFGNAHSFILKLDAAGDFAWVRDIGAQTPAIGIGANAAGRDKDGNLYFSAGITGNGNTSLDLDPGSGVYNIVPNLGDLLLEKLDSGGNFIWAKLITGDNAKTPYSLGFDSASNVFIAGTLLGSADFDPGLAVYTLTAVPGSFVSMTDFFVAKYDSAGNFSWAHSFGGNGDDRTWGGDVDRFGNVLVTGSFEGTIDFDPGPGVHNVMASSTRNSFTLRLKNNGDFSWVTPYLGVTSGRSVATDDTGNVYTAITLNSSYVVVQKLDSAGNDVWAAGLEGDIPGWIGLDNKDSIYITGSLTGFNKDFDPGPGTYLLSSTGGSTSSGFIVKLNQTLLPTGVAEKSLQTAAVNVYPNPSSGIITFSAPTAIQRMEITDLTGKVVYRAEPAQMKTEIDFGGKAAGVYFYEVDCGVGK